MLGGRKANVYTSISMVGTTIIEQFYVAIQYMAGAGVRAGAGAEA